MSNKMKWGRKTKVLFMKQQISEIKHNKNISETFFFAIKREGEKIYGIENIKTFKDCDEIVVEWEEKTTTQNFFSLFLSFSLSFSLSPCLLELYRRLPWYVGSENGVCSRRVMKIKWTPEEQETKKNWTTKIKDKNDLKKNFFYTRKICPRRLKKSTMKKRTQHKKILGLRLFLGPGAENEPGRK